MIYSELTKAELERLAELRENIKDIRIALRDAEVALKDYIQEMIDKYGQEEEESNVSQANKR